MKAKRDYGEKTYNRCLSCHHRQVRCNGPRTSAMDLARWCEFMRDMKDVNGLTNAEVAEKSGVSLKTIERLMAQNCEQDIMRETARRIEDAIIGSSIQYPCYLAFEEAIPEDRQKLDAALIELEHALDHNRDYQTALNNIHLSYNAEIQTIREESKRKVEFLLLQNERLNAEIEYLRRDNERKGEMLEMYFKKPL